ncbi:uncharacterized protein G2W53_009769 [Senna tora]|uniref:Uncharacterized protein n=1 Tax=Senna tora TaxID=362788 RepID=A0A834WZ42_9FABA|nr:uncharacterized protein G2W53_009769 [Senna tora]
MGGAWIMSYHISDDKSRSDLINLHYLRGKRLVAQKPSRITRQKACCASERKTLVRVVFPNRSGFDDPIEFIMAWEDQEKSLSDLRNLHELKGKRLVAQVIETRRLALYLQTRVDLMLQLESSWHGSSVDHVLTYSGRQIAVGSQKPSRITRQKTCYANEKSRSDLRNLHELRGKRLVAQVSKTRRFALYLRTGLDLMIQLESSMHGRSVDHVLPYSGREIAVGSKKPSQITRQKTCCAIVKAWEERGSCLTYSEWQIAVGSQKPSRITRQKTCCASEQTTSVRVVFANRFGLDDTIGVVKAWEERGSCLNIFRMRNRGRI